MRLERLMVASGTRTRLRQTLPGQVGGVAVLLLAGATVTRTLDEGRLAELSARVAALENAKGNATPAAGMTIMAPFTVTDAKNVPILQVRENPRSLVLMDGAKNIAISAAALQDGGFVKVNTISDKEVVVLGAAPGRSSFEIRDGPTKANNRLVLETDSVGAPALTLLGKTHTPVLTLVGGDSAGGRFTLSNPQGKALVTGSALLGGGVLKVLNPAETRVGVIGVNGEDAGIALRDGLTTGRIALTLAKDKSAAMTLWNNAYKAIFVVTEGARRDGMFQLSDHGGLPMLEGGVTPDGHGIVRAGPSFKCVGNAGLGAPDCVLGHAP